jgi:hypothetical protein
VDCSSPPELAVRAEAKPSCPRARGRGSELGIPTLTARLRGREQNLEKHDPASEDEEEADPTDNVESFFFDLGDGIEM